MACIGSGPETEPHFQITPSSRGPKKSSSWPQEQPGLIESCPPPRLYSPMWLKPACGRGHPRHSSAPLPQQQGAPAPQRLQGPRLRPRRGLPCGPPACPSAGGPPAVQDQHDPRPGAARGVGPVQHHPGGPRENWTRQCWKVGTSRFEHFF